MNINELDELTKEWNRFDADNEYLQSFLELIAAYREAVAALVFANKELKEWNSCSSGEDFNSLQINKALDTAKRLGVE